MGKRTEGLDDAHVPESATEKGHQRRVRVSLERTVKQH